MPEEQVILVDEQDNDIGQEGKMRAHENGGVLHRAFSVFIFNENGKMLLQKRGKSKYHFGGLWTNTCCSHPRPGETVEQAAHRKLKQEMGFDTELKEIFTFIYKAAFENGLTEHELDHVFVGKYDGKPDVNPEEADDHAWVDIRQLQSDVAKKPGNYTPWFKIALKKVIDWKEKNDQ
jgi:isopentenyl-diphosphate delta-isomerase